MAWTAPRTWVTGEIVTAALMNTHLRDNMLDIDSRLNADTVVTVVAESSDTHNSTTVKTDDELTLPVLANTRYTFEAIVSFAAPAATDFRHQFIGPSGSTVRWVTTGIDPAGSPSGVFFASTSTVTVAGTDGLTLLMTAQGFVFVDSTPGFFSFNFGTGTGTSTVTREAGSKLTITKAA